jgi:SAM-dependent methyltransferase
LVTTFDTWERTWEHYDRTLRRLSLLPFVGSVCDVGGGAKPSLGPDEIARARVRYTLLDVSRDELEKAPAGYDLRVGDITEDDSIRDLRADLICSRTTAEHVADPVAFHTNVFRCLNAGGYALHLFPTLYSLPFMANLVLPDGVADAALRRIHAWRTKESASARFTAYYKWCRGPTNRQVRRLAALGYEVVEYAAFFGHGYYNKFRPMLALEQAKTRVLLRHPVPTLTSYAVVLLRKPESCSSESVTD